LAAISGTEISVTVMVGVAGAVLFTTFTFATSHVAAASVVEV